jgi:hypothetical protein
MTTDEFIKGAILVLLGALCAVMFVYVMWG